MSTTETTGLVLPTEIEGALAAHRKLLELIVTLLGELKGDALALVDEIERRIGHADHSEDPGAEPDPAFAVEHSTDDELKRVLRNVRAAVDFGASSAA